MWRNSPRGWGLTSITLHWLSAIAVIGLFALGWWMTGLDYYDAWYHRAPWWHKSVGMVLLGLTLARVVWRLVQHGCATIVRVDWQDGQTVHFEGCAGEESRVRQVGDGYVQYYRGPMGTESLTQIEYLSDGLVTHVESYVGPVGEEKVVSIECRFTSIFSFVDGELEEENTATGVNAQTVCVVKSA